MEITYLDKDGVGYESYFYAVGPALYRIDFSYKGESGMMYISAGPYK